MTSQPARHTTRLVLGCAVALLLAAPASGSGKGGLGITLALPPGNGGFTAVSFEVAAGTGQVESKIVPLHPEPLPVDRSPTLAGHDYADWRVVLDPGVYRVTATPLRSDGPSCRTAASDTSVASGTTTELVLVSECSPSVGGTSRFFGLASGSLHGASVRICELDPACERSCRREAKKTRRACRQSGKPKAACAKRFGRQLQACVDSKCRPGNDCESRCEARAADLLQRCLAAGNELTSCDLQARRAERACVENDCQPCLCPDVYAPVCGHDGVTYGNSCEAGCERARVRHAGPCEPICTPATCVSDCDSGFARDENGCPTCECNPTVCGSDGDCSAGERCSSEVCIDTCFLDEPICVNECVGFCVADQCTCPDHYDPVCGVDGETYDNVCEAENCAGVEVAHEGTCGGPCPCPGTFDPVCGADGETYGNACLAECAGVEIAHEGTCG